jgi:hypothetical protein
MDDYCDEDIQVSTGPWTRLADGIIGYGTRAPLEGGSDRAPPVLPGMVQEPRTWT